MPRWPLFLLLLVPLDCAAPVTETLCGSIEGVWWAVPSLLQPVLEVGPGACMVYQYDGLTAVEATGWGYDPVGATCQDGIMELDGHGKFVLYKDGANISVWSRKYLVGLDFEPCP